MNSKKYKIVIFTLIGIIVLVCSFSIFYINNLQTKNSDLKSSNETLNYLLDSTIRSETSLEMQLDSQSKLLNQVIMENVNLIKSMENQ